MFTGGKKRCALLVAFGMVVLSHAALPPIVYVVRRQYAVDHHNTGTDFTAGDVSCHNVRPGAAIRRLDGITSRPCWIALRA